MFQQEEYKLAASCFRSALDDGQASYCEGFHFIAIKNNGEAKSIFRTAAKIFFEASNFRMCLESFKQLGHLCLAELKEHGRAKAELSWDQADNAILDAALEKFPGHLPREETVSFALLRSSWRTITAEDMVEFPDMFRPYR